ncbi:MAG: hypothetical protein ACK5WZ_09595, partial [Pseudobdellovibrionaceae bacterium]
MKIYLAPLATSVLLCIMTWNASAEKVSQVLLTEKDWSVTQITDSETQSSACVAETKKINSTIVSELKLVLPKQEDRSAQIILTATGLPAEIKAAYVRPDSKTIYPLLTLSVNAETGVSEFILLPHRNEEVLDLLLTKSVLDIYFGEGKAAILARVSLKGSTKVLQKTRECRASKEIVNEALSDKIKKDLKKAVAVEGTLEQLLLLDQQMHSNDAQLKLKESELKLTKTNLKSTKQVDAQLKTKIASISQTILKSQKEVSDLSIKLNEEQTLLAQSQTDLPINQEKIPGLVSAKDLAQAALDPVKAQVRKIESELSALRTQEANLEQAALDLSFRRSQLIDSLNQMANEVNRLRQERSQIDFQAAQISDLFRRKEFEYRNYNVEMEVRRMLDSNFQYRNYQVQLEDLRRRQQILPGEIGALQGQVSVMQIEVEQCRAAQPPQDCSSQIGRLQEVQALLNNKNSELNQIRQQFENVRAQMQWIEQDIRRQVQNFQSGLLNEVNRLSAELRNLEIAANRNDQRTRDLQQFEIPRAEQERRQVESDLLQAENRLVDASARVRRKQSELSQFKKENQYELLSDNLKAAQKALSDIEDLLKKAQKNITTLPAKITATKVKLDAAQAKLNLQTESLAVED